MFRSRRESDSVGSLVGNNGRPVEGSIKKREKASGSEPEPGPFVVAVKTNENDAPKVTVARYSLKNEESFSVTVPGKDPDTPPVPELPRKLPFVEKSDKNTEFEGGPPSTKSNAMSAVVPDSEEVVTVIVVGWESARVVKGYTEANKKIIPTQTTRSALQRPLGWLIILNSVKIETWADCSRCVRSNTRLLCLVSS